MTTRQIAFFCAWLLMLANTAARPLPAVAIERLRAELEHRFIKVRVYPDWKSDPRAFETVSAEAKLRNWADTDGRDRSLGTVVLFHVDRALFSDTTVIAVVEDDQYDPIIKAMIAGSVHVWWDKKLRELLKDDEEGASNSVCFQLARRFATRPLYSTQRPALPKQSEDLCFTDGLGGVLADANVELMLARDYNERFPFIWLCQRRTDAVGRMELPEVIMHNLKCCRVRLQHADYGIAETTFPPSERKRAPIRLPLIGEDSPYLDRALIGRVSTPEGRPVSDALIVCRHVRTPGGGLIQVRRPAWVWTDRTGRFRVYHSNAGTDRGRSEIIPPGSFYSVAVYPPRELGLLPYQGMQPNGRAVQIELERGEQFHTFSFRDEFGNPLDPRELGAVNLTICRPDLPPVVLGRRYEPAGLMLPNGTYEISMGGRRFQPIEVGPGSPTELVFAPPAAVMYSGRVIDGISGDPIPGAVVIDSSGPGFSQSSPDFWALLRSLPDPIAAKNKELEATKRSRGIRAIGRVDVEGRFEMLARPGVPDVSAFAEGYLGYCHNLRGSPAQTQRRVALPDFTLFPSAEVRFEVRSEGGPVKLWPEWAPNAEGVPAWGRPFLHLGSCGHRRFAYQSWLRSNRRESLLVPANVQLGLTLRPSNDRWCTARVPQTITLDAGERLDLGAFDLEATIPVMVQVLDSKGNPVEGVPVRMKTEVAWGLVRNSDEKGLCRFYIEPHSEGYFGVSAYLGEQRDPLPARVQIPFSVGGRESDTAVFDFRLSDETLSAIFK